MIDKNGENIGRYVVLHMENGIVSRRKIDATAWIVLVSFMVLDFLALENKVVS